MFWVITGVAIIIGIFALSMLKNIQARRAKEVLDKFRDKKVLGITSNANFFGQESQGLAQIRGNGVLLLTEEELYFKMWVPKREFHIPISCILKVETPRSHLRKTKSVPLLKVIFKNDRGETDSVAWLVKNLSRWKEVIEKLAQRENTKTDAAH